MGSSPAWGALAACRDIDTAVFYPPSNSTDDAQEAKAVCVTCPVAPACLLWALEWDEKHGVWGGKTENERNTIGRRLRVSGRLRRRRRCTRCGAAFDLRADQRWADACPACADVADRERSRRYSEEHPEWVRDVKNRSRRADAGSRSAQAG